MTLMRNFPIEPQRSISPQAASPFSSLPGIGQVRQIRDNNASPKLVAADATDARSRPFNLLRSQLIKRLAQDGSHLVGITSVAPGAGKSFIASNLAVSIAQLSNKRIFLIDADLRRASIADIFGIEANIGLADYLSGDDVRLQDIGCQIGDSNLVIYPSLPAQLRSAELLGGVHFETLMAAVRALSKDTLVIFDLPPVFANDDTLLVADKLDGMLMVVEQGVTTKKQLQSAIQLLQPTPIIGSVFNRSDGGFGDPYGYSGKYGKYYSK
jgi:protein-tyrosine kinase